MLVAGGVAVEKLRGDWVVELARLSAGECFGQIGLIDAHLRSTSVRAKNSAMAMLSGETRPTSLI